MARKALAVLFILLIGIMILQAGCDGGGSGSGSEASIRQSDGSEGDSGTHSSGGNGSLSEPDSAGSSLPSSGGESSLSSDGSAITSGGSSTVSSAVSTGQSKVSSAAGSAASSMASSSSSSASASSGKETAYYLAGSWNGYTVDDENYRMTLVPGSTHWYTCTVALTADNRDEMYDGHWYKVTEGNWDHSYGIDNYCLQPAPVKHDGKGNAIGLGSIWVDENITLTVLFDSTARIIYDNADGKTLPTP